MERDLSKDKRFEEIYRTYQHDVYKISLYYTKDEYIAQDIAQKSFYKLYLHFNNVNIDNSDSVRSYLLRTARNMSYNWLRDTKRERGDYVDNIPEDSAILHSPEDEYIWDERLKEKQKFACEILHTIREENESWYDILNLIYCLEKPHDEVAKELGISRDVLYSKLYRAKRWVRKHYEEQYTKL